MNTKGIVFATNGTPAETLILLDGRPLGACQGISFIAEAGAPPLFNLKLYSLRANPMLGDVDENVSTIVDRYKFVFFGADYSVYVDHKQAGYVVVADVFASVGGIKIGLIVKKGTSLVSPWPWLIVGDGQLPR
jgi:hypothetical protein